MDGAHLQDLVAKGQGVAARKLGTPYTVFRPHGATQPLASAHRVITLDAAFEVGRGAAARGAGYGQALWTGVFDSSYTAPGDYLMGASGTYFVASQKPALPVQCVLTNAVVSASRATAPGPGGYGSDRTAVLLLRGFPASMLAIGNARGDAAASDRTRRGVWTVLLPVLPANVNLSAADVVTDDAGRRLVLEVTELSDLGWRCTAREISA